MLKKMRRDMILAAMLAFFAVVLLLTVLVNAANYYVATERMDKTLSYIFELETSEPEVPEPMDEPEENGEAAQSGAQMQPGAFFPPGDGRLPEGEPGAGGFMGAAPGQDLFMMFPDAEASYTMRFFTVCFDSEGNVKSTYVDYVASIDEEVATEFAADVLNNKSESGYYNSYRYYKASAEDATYTIFLYAGQEQQSMKTLLTLSLAVAAGSLLLVLLLVILFSRKAVKPFADNIRRQKEFITDASHELKTPITSITASVDVIALDYGEDEWTDNIRKQTGRMTKLVSELVTLSKLDEVTPLPKKEHFSLSNSAWEILEVYQMQAKAQNKQLTVNIQDDIDLFGEKEAIQQMLSVLMDNAIRYSPEGSEIRLSVYKKRNHICIETFNTCLYEDRVDVKRIFDRFYRADSSRNSETGGNGVGLAIAKAVVESHGGSIKATCPSGKTMTIKVML